MPRPARRHSLIPRVELSPWLLIVVSRRAALDESFPARIHFHGGVGPFAWPAFDTRLKAINGETDILIQK